MLRMQPAVGAAVFVVGIVLFVVGIVDATAGAPSGTLSVEGGDTPWLIFAGVACCILGGILFSVAIGRGRRSSAPTAQQLNALIPTGVPGRTPADPVDRLEKLVALRDAGALTAAEFAAQKAKILGGS